MRNVFERSKTSYIGRNYLYIFPSPQGTFWAVNYHAINAGLNSILTLFDIWGGKSGKSVLSSDGIHQEVWFEVDEEFYKLATQTTIFKRAFTRLGVEVVFDYPFKDESETIE